MKQLVVLSGKGGTGKTTIVSGFITLAYNKAFADCDVDAPNLNLLYDRQEELIERKPFLGYPKAVRKEEQCLNCGKCEKLCRFGAIQGGRIFPYECEGCGVCEAFCPSRDQEGNPAIRLADNTTGWTSLARVNREIFSTARLKIGNGASGKLVTEVRKNLLKQLEGEELIIIDGSPGIGCPVIASITGVDLVLLVTEPTLSGIHDLKRILKTVQRFEVPVLACINKYDLNQGKTNQIMEYCQQEKISLVGKIPFDPRVITAINSGQTIVTDEASPAAGSIKEIWQEVARYLLKEEKGIDK